MTPSSAGRPGCTGKTAYPTRRDAEKARQGLALKPTRGWRKKRRKSMAAMNKAYHCDHCGGWHLGRVKPKPATRRPLTGPKSMSALAARTFAAFESLPE